ncbi:cytochrome P450 [Favolaschia claudopus]|uniref:Cytochrome P450 n=1 Tax=Favolaschia claudopus TaxID=2862362 RepID=A0AAW0A058_9AGAR
MPLSALNLLWLSLGLYIVFATWNFLSNPGPLRKIPGPWLAARTRWYRAYFDLIRDGGYLKHLQWLHTQYGPVVRVGPNEVHFSDPEVYDTIYGHRSTFTKDPFIYGAFKQDLSSFGFQNPHEARKRREMLSPLFSRRAILKLEHAVQTRVSELVTRLNTCDSSIPCNLSMAFRSATLDIITTYCFAQSFSTLSHPTFHHPILLAILSGVTTIWTFKYFPSIYILANLLPSWLMQRIARLSKGYAQLIGYLSNHLDEIIADPSKLESNSAGPEQQETIYSHLLNPINLEKHDVPSKQSLLDESMTLLGAGSETTGNVVTSGVFRVLNNARIIQRLQAELDEAFPADDSETGMPKMSYQDGYQSNLSKLTWPAKTNFTLLMAGDVNLVSKSTV